jgi:hypothetical protein
MPYLIVTADFPSIKPNELEDIYACLEKARWHQIHEHDGYEGTTWFTSINYYLPLQETINEATEQFNRCCTPYCKPRLVVETSANAAVHNTLNN